jgi:hypothetical protein
VRDTQTGRGYRVVPGTIVPADTFAVSDSWVLQYKPNEIDDNGSGGCALNFSALLNGEPIDNQDVVLWVRGGQLHQANSLDHCGTSVYTSSPLGTGARSPAFRRSAKGASGPPFFSPVDDFWYD